eukprot:scaffold3166_cov102-Skeletonema_marinoi.AAC.6
MSSAGGFLSSLCQRGSAAGRNDQAFSPCISVLQKAKFELEKAVSLYGFRRYVDSHYDTHGELGVVGVWSINLGVSSEYRVALWQNKYSTSSVI